MNQKTSTILAGAFLCLSLSGCAVDGSVDDNIGTLEASVGVLCPKNVTMANGTKVGPTRAFLTSNKEICRVTKSQFIEGGVSEFQLDREGIKLSQAKFGAFEISVTTVGRDIRVQAFIAGTPVFFQQETVCEEFSPVLQTQDSAWHSVNYRGHNGRPLYYGASDHHDPDDSSRHHRYSCIWDVDSVEVDFPRQSNDIAVNLTEDGILRTGHMTEEIWEGVCSRECNKSHTCNGIGCGGIGDSINACISTCVANERLP